MNGTNLTDVSNVPEMPFFDTGFAIELWGVILSAISVYLLWKVHRLEKLTVSPHCILQYQPNWNLYHDVGDDRVSFCNIATVEKTGGAAKYHKFWFRTVFKSGKIIKEIGNLHENPLMTEKRSEQLYHEVIIDTEDVKNIDEVFCLMTYSDIAENQYFAFSSFRYKAVNPFPRWTWDLRIKSNPKRLRWWNKKKVKLFIDNFDEWKRKYGG